MRRGGGSATVCSVQPLALTERQEDEGKGVN
jgi:hypothetical protein